MHPTIAAAIDRWTQTTDDLAALARNFDASKLDATSAAGTWTNRELLVHLATGYGVRIAALEHIVDGAPERAIVADDANAANVARLSGADTSAIVAEMMATRGRILSLLQRLRDDDLQRTTVLGDGKPLADVILNLSAHDLEHAAELRM